MAEVPVAPALAAVMVAVPTATAVTTPVWVTDAMRESLVLHETGRFVTKFSSTQSDVDATHFRWWFEEELDGGEVRQVGREATLYFLYRREAELLFPAAGFELDSMHGAYDGSPVEPTSQQLLIVARRKERGARVERRRR